MKKELLVFLVLSIWVHIGFAQVNSVPTSGYVINARQQYNDWANAGEAVTSMFDGKSTTKWLTNHNTNWIYFQINEGFTFIKYSIQSGNDSPARDPKNWELFASSDSVNWVSIDVRSNETFATRLLVKEYTFANTVSGYKHFKLNITLNNGNSATQITDLVMYASSSSNKVYTGAPLPRIGVNKPYVNANEVVRYYDFSTRKPTTHSWSFPGATPSTSTAAEQNVSYANLGKYGAQLTASNQYGSNSVSVNTVDNLHDYLVLVKNPTPADNDWSTFPFPQVEVQEISGQPGIDVANMIFPNFQDSVQKIALGVCKTLYKNVQEVPAFDKVIIRLESYNGVAGKSGAPPIITISFSTKYIEDTYIADGNFDNVAYEMKGVLWHEITHAYQNVPQNAGNYSGGTDFYGFIEGVADYVRIVNGFHNTRTASAGGTYGGGYTTSAFFLVYIADKYYGGDYDQFMYEFNGTAIGLNEKWTFDDALYMLLGKGVDELWSDYQLSFNGSAPQTPVADFSTRDVLICKNQAIDFENKTYHKNSATTFAWTFAGGSPGSSTDENASVISYSTAGTYNVSMTATNSFGSNTATKSSYIRVLDYDGYLFDLTDYYGGISSQYGDTIASEGMAQLVDNNSNTKFLMNRNNVWIQWQSLGAYRLVAYSLTSGGDAPERDPKNWVIKGSNDGVNWTTLDAVNNYSFTARKQLKTFVISNPSAFTFSYFRMEMNTDVSPKLMQFSEWQLFGISNIDPAILFANMTKNNGDPDFFASASSNSSGALTYSILSGGQYATITSDGQVSITGAGTVTIQVSQAAAAGFNAATATATLTINAVSAVNNKQLSNAQVKVFPNPGNDMVNLEFTLSESCNGKIELCELNGRVIQVIAEGNINPQSQFNFPVSELSQGIYILKFVNDKGEFWNYKLCKR